MYILQNAVAFMPEMVYNFRWNTGEVRRFLDNSLYASTLYVEMNKIIENVNFLCRRHSTVIPVLKSNAYGLGLVPVARAVTTCPRVGMVAVAQVLEGARLREGGVRGDILVLGGSLPSQWSAAAELGLTLAVTRPGMVAELGRLGKPIRVHLKIETGLNRTGIRPGGELAGVIGELRDASCVTLTGTYSHFAEAESRNRTRCLAQKAEFDRALAQLEAAGVQPGLRHMCNSAAAEWLTEGEYDAVRIGRGLYMDAQDCPLGGIQEAASWRAAIVGLRELPGGTRLGYGSGIVLPDRMRVAVVNVGYGDGLNRQVAQGGPVLISGRRARLLGCCMDQCFVDVGQIPCDVGSEVTLFGYDSLGNLLSSQEVARLCDDEGCGLTAALGDRVKRVYRN